MGTEPNLAVDFIPSEEYVSRTFKTGSEFLSRMMETMSRETAIAPPPVTAAETLPQYQQELRSSLDKSVQWLNTQTPTPQYYDWRYDMDPRAGRITLFRIADEPLNEDALRLIASTIRRDTGLGITVSEQHLARVISRFSYPVADATLARDMDTAMQTIRDREGVTVTVRLKDPERFKDRKSKAATARMNERLLTYLRARIPERQLLVGEPGDAWEVTLAIQPKAGPRGPGGQARESAP